MQRFPLSNVGWRFRDASEKTWREAEVPGCVHTDLLRAGVIEDPFWGRNELEVQWIEERDWEYRARFTVPAALRREQHIELVADGLDTVATVFLNGQEIGRSDNMFVGHRWNVGALLRRGNNELVVRFDSAMRYVRSHHTDLEQGELNDPLGLAPAIRKQQCQFGWDWGPRLVSAGIWQDIRLEAWSDNRLQSVRITQTHRDDGSVRLDFSAELEHAENNVFCTGNLHLDGQVVAHIEDSHAVLTEPALWWPNGHGAQPLYTARIEVKRTDGSAIGTFERRIGLRTVQLDRHADEAGESFGFVVNGRAIFAKGANWIPAHAFVTTLGRDDYARDLRAAVAAHMNMIRVWGGGIYESEHFYDLCDELGLLVWQDFMFACALYPGDADFVASVREEATQQVRRLRHRACLALWCGNNEVEQLNVERLKKPHRQEQYAAVFERALPEVVLAHDGVTSYWQSSQHRPDGDNHHAAGERHGDTHYWDVWHARHPVKDYEKWRFRFCSEFGMQSYSSKETNQTFCAPGDDNVFGASMENHQKNRGGNQVILDYVSRRYRFPSSQDGLIYLSQLNQAYCMQVGVEHYRRLMPHCMGALYWQLNDCWPVASWSSIEFTGRWRALHHVARRFFAPALVSAHVPGDDVAGPGNYRHNDVREVHLYTVYDAPEPTRGTLRWDLFHVDGRVLQRGGKSVTLRHGESILQRTLDFSRALAKHGPANLLLRIALDLEPAKDSSGHRGAPTCVSQDTVFFTPPRFVELPRARTRSKLRALGPRQLEIELTSNAFQHRVEIDLPGIAHASSDNYFDLYPGESKRVVVDLRRALPLERLRRTLTLRSLRDTYP